MNTKIKALKNKTSILLKLIADEKIRHKILTLRREENWNDFLKFWYLKYVLIHFRIKEYILITFSVKIVLK